MGRLKKVKIKKRVTPEQAIENKKQKEEDAEAFIGFTGRRLFRKMQLHFRSKKFALNSYGSHLDKIEVREAYYRGENKEDISEPELSPTELNVLWKEFELKYFLLFSQGATTANLITEGMQQERALELFELYNIEKIKIKKKA